MFCLPVVYLFTGVFVYQCFTCLPVLYLFTGGLLDTSVLFTSGLFVYQCICLPVVYMFTGGLFVYQWFICLPVVYLFTSVLFVYQWFICLPVVYLFTGGLFVYQFLDDSVHHVGVVHAAPVVLGDVFDVDARLVLVVRQVIVHPVLGGGTQHGGGALPLGLFHRHLRQQRGIVSRLLLGLAVVAGGATALGGGIITIQNIACIA